jgi:hypothetical protein
LDLDLDALSADSSESSRAGDLGDDLLSSDALVSLGFELLWALGDALSVSEFEPALGTAELALVRGEGGGVLVGVLDFPLDGLPLVGLVALVDDGGRLGLLRLVVGRVPVRLAAQGACLLRGPHAVERSSAVDS